MFDALIRGLASGTGRRVAGIYAFLGLANILLWAVALVVIHDFPLLLMRARPVQDGVSTRSRRAATIRQK